MNLVRQPLGKPKLRGILLLLLAAIGTFAWAAPEPVVRPSKDAPFAGEQIKWFQRSQFTLFLMAERSCAQLAAIYAKSDPRKYPGLNSFGQQLQFELLMPARPLDFQRLVSHNPLCWRAERELNVLDPSFPLLVSMLAVLSGDQSTATRLLALTQSALPLTPKIRRAYALPEALIGLCDYDLSAGIGYQWPSLSAKDCADLEEVVRARIARWPKQQVLLGLLIQLEVTRAQRIDPTGKALNEPIGQSLRLTDKDWSFLGENDLILAEALHATGRQWLEKNTLAQRWFEWTDGVDPADGKEVERTVELYEHGGRPDLAWLTWRCALVLNMGISDRERSRWRVWCRELLKPADAEQLVKIASANPLAGSATLSVPFEKDYEGWTGDQNINPLVELMIERELARIDAMLLWAPRGSQLEGIDRYDRAGILLSIKATGNAQKEFERAEAILGKDNWRILTLQARIAELNGDFSTAERILKELLAMPDRSDDRYLLAGLYYREGKLAEARVEFRKMISAGIDVKGYAYLFAALAGGRCGGNEAALLHKAEGKYPDDPWVTAGILFLLGKTSTDDILRLARKGTLFDIKKKECEGWFWIGETRLAKGDKTGAIDAFHQCVATGFTVFLEYEIARAELKQLEGAPKPDREKRPPRDTGPEIARDTISMCRRAIS